MPATFNRTVLAIMGSPNRGGNSELLLDAVLEGAEDDGFEIHKLVPSELEILPCRNCGGCAEDGTCVIADEMQAIFQWLKSAECLILAAPLYFMGIPAQTKALIDCCQAIWVEKYIIGKGQPPKAARSSRRRVGAFISTGGQNIKGMFDGAEKTVRAFFTTLDVELVETLYFTRIEPAKIVEHPTAIDDARALGQRLKSYFD
jgi:multimeric flavodoxin WrbA